MPNIAIIGAGMAGLAAAQQLCKYQNVTITLFEARDRVGGRAYTTYFNPQALNPIPFDRGCHWIHGVDDNPISAISTWVAQQTNNPQYQYVVPDQEGGPQVWSNGAQNVDRTHELDLYWFNFEQALEAEIPDDQGNLTTSVTEILQLSNNPDRAALVDQPSFYLYQLLQLSMEIGTEGYRANAADILRAEGHLDGRGPEVEGSNGVVPAGLGALIAEFGRLLVAQANQNAQVITQRLSAPVTGVQAGLNNVTVRYTLQGPQQADFDAAIITVPSGLVTRDNVQGKIRVSGGDQALTDAINAYSLLPLGNYKKVALKFPDGTLDQWVNPNKRYLPNSFGKGAEPVFIALIEAGNVAMLQSGGHPAYGLDGLGDAEIAQRACAALTDMLGMAIAWDQVESYQVTNWAGDALSGGAYAYTHVHENAYAARTTLIDYQTGHRLIFAGEAVVEKAAGSLHGAYWSGNSAAVALAATLNLQLA